MKMLLLLLSVVVLSIGCGASTAAIRSGAVQSANMSISVAVVAFRSERLVCVEKASTRADAEKCVKGVEDRYAPVWTAWDKFRAAEDQAKAWCEFAKAMPPELKPQAVEDLTCP